MKKKSTLLLLAVMVLVVLLQFSLLMRQDAEAEPVYPAKGVVTANPFAYMRRDPNTSREPLRNLYKDIEVEVLGEVEGQMVGSNPIWYEIMYGNIHGYISAEFIRLNFDFNIDNVGIPPLGPTPNAEEFRAGLVNSGFPADYVEPLMALHAKYPYWTFTPLHVNYSFSTAVKGQFRPGVNMITSNSPPEYKSQADTDYNYHTNTWREYEPGWVGASRELIAFQMDPRNFLSEVQIFQFESQRYNANVPYRTGLANILQNTFMKESKVRYLDEEGDEVIMESSYLDLIDRAGQESGVSPYHLVSRIIQEVGLNGSASVSGKYSDLKGYYNYYNIGAYGGSDPVYNGLITARDGIKGYSSMKNSTFLFPWDNPADAITGGAIFIGEDYIKVDQHTLFLQKFNLASRYTRPFTHQYMGNVLAPEYEAINVFKSYENMGALYEPKEFIIPVYLDMPDIVPSPTGTGNPNNWLKMISINGQEIPNFSPEIYEYKVEISAASKGLAVRGETYAGESYVVGNGLYALKPGSNEIILQVISSSGSKRNYRIHVSQGTDTAGQDPDHLPKLQNEDYKINALGYLYGPDPLTGSNSREQILGQYSLPASYSLDLLGPNGQAVERAGTGSVLRLRKNGDLVNEFPVVVMGDVNGDAAIDILDFTSFRGSILSGEQVLDTNLNLAMDINQDGQVDILDLMLLREHVLGRQNISQRLR